MPHPARQERRPSNRRPRPPRPPVGGARWPSGPPRQRKKEAGGWSPAYVGIVSLAWVQTKNYSEGETFARPIHRRSDFNGECPCVRSNKLPFFGSSVIRSR